MHAACTHCCWQGGPAARHQRMRFAPTVLGRSCRRLISVACRLHPVVLEVATACEAYAHSACMQCCWQEVPAARHQLRRMQLPSIVVARRHQLRRMPLARIVAARSCRLRGTSMLLASIVASMRAACRQCCWQEVPAARPQCMRFAPIAAGRSYRRRSSVACRLHPGWLDVPAGGGASAHAGCSYR